MDLRAYLRILRNWWWLLLLGPVLAGAAALYVSKQMTPIYASSATLLINQTQTPGTVQYNDILTSERLTNTYAELVERQVILTTVIERLALDLSDTELGVKISVEAVPNTQLLKISSEDPAPQTAAEISNQVAEVFIADNASSLGRPGTVTIAQRALVPDAPVKPDVELNVVLAAIAGLLLVSVVAFVVEYLDDTVKAGEELDHDLDFPTLGVVGRMKKRSGRVAIPFDHRSVEAYVRLRTNVQFAAVGRELKSIVIASSHPKEGKSTTAAGLSMVLAQAGSRVILVDTDLRRPSLHEIFSLPNSAGLTSLLLDPGREPGAILQRTSVKNLLVLSSGPVPPNPADLLMSATMAALRQSLEKSADYIVYDTPPVLAVTDANILAADADGVILVSASHATRRSSVRAAIRELSRSRAKLLGFVVNKARSRSRGYYGYYEPDTQQQPAPLPAKGRRAA